MATEGRLRDGSVAVMWPLLPEDREGLRAAYERLSPATQRERFLTPVPRLTEAMLRNLVDTVDGDHHVALVMTAFDTDGTDRVVGVAHLLRHPDEPEAADVAVTVAEDFRGRGAASALLAELVARRPRGLTRIVADVLADNEASLRMLGRVGPTEVSKPQGGVCHVSVDLRGSPRHRTQRAAGSR